MNILVMKVLIQRIIKLPVGFGCAGGGGGDARYGAGRGCCWE